MGKKRHTAEQIVTKLRQVEVESAQGTAVVQACRKVGITE